MRIAAVSDLHGDLPRMPKCDVLLIGGDVCPVNDHSDAFQRSWLQTNFANWLNEQPAACILGIAGNHDFALERHEDLAFNLPWTYLLDNGVEIDGVKFWGSPWVPNLSRWAFHALDHVLDEKFAAIPDDTHVVISHGPPLGHLDFTVPRFGSVHAGFPGTNAMLERVKPALFFCGHIHEGYGQEVHPSGTAMFNCSRMTETYRPINPCWELTLSTNEQLGVFPVVHMSPEQQRRLDIPGRTSRAQFQRDLALHRACL